MTDTPPEGPAAFISYCHDDKAIAVAVQKALEGRGWQVFRDETDVQPGDPLPTTLADGIDRSDLFIAVVSESYNPSKACAWELNLAVARKFGDDPLRIVPLKVGKATIPSTLSAERYVKIIPGEEHACVDEVLRERRLIEQTQAAARPASREGASAPDRAARPSEPRELVREAVRYARELETLAQIDGALVDVQVAVASTTRSYDERAYSEAHRLWEDAWVRRTSPVTDRELLDRIQVVGSLLSEVVHSDRTPRQIRPWMIQRAVTSARAAAGYAMRDESLPTPTFPGMAELRKLLGEGDSLDDPAAPLRERLRQLGTPSFHPPS